MLKGIHHSGLSVLDLEKAIGFYTGVGGYVVVLRFSIPDTAENRLAAEIANASAEVAWLKCSTGYLELLQFSEPGNTEAAPPAVHDTGIRHICLQSKDGDELFDRAKSSGATWHARPAGLGTGNLYAYVRDPMDNVLELEGLPYAPEPGAETWYAHTAYVVENIEQMVAFYEALSGLSREREGTFGPGEPFDTVSGLKDTHVKGAWIPLPNSILEFWQYLSPQSENLSGAKATDLGYTHTCFEVDDMDAAVGALSAIGVELLSKPLVSESNSVVFGRDVEGNLFELISFRGAGKGFSLDALSREKFPDALKNAAVDFYKAQSR